MYERDGTSFRKSPKHHQETCPPKASPSGGKGLLSSKADQDEHVFFAGDRGNGNILRKWVCQFQHLCPLQKGMETKPETAVDRVHRVQILASPQMWPYLEVPGSLEASVSRKCPIGLPNVQEKQGEMDIFTTLFHFTTHKVTGETLWITGKTACGNKSLLMSKCMTWLKHILIYFASGMVFLYLRLRRTLLFKYTDSGCGTHVWAALALREIAGRPNTTEGMVFL